MIELLDRLFRSKSWVAISVACSLYALYEGVEKLWTGDPVEGAFDFVLTAVLVINLVNRSHGLAGYAKKLRS